MRGSAGGALGSQNNPPIIRAELLNIHTDVLFEAFENQEPLSLNLFPDVEMTAVINRLESTKEGGKFSEGVLNYIQKIKQLRLEYQKVC